MEKVIKIYCAGHSLWVGGNTYEVRETIKFYGFRWNPQKKEWWRTFSGFSIVPRLVKSLLDKGYRIDLAKNLQRLVCPVHGTRLDDAECPECLKTDAIVGAELAEARAMNTAQKIAEHDSMEEL